MNLEEYRGTIDADFIEKDGTLSFGHVDYDENGDWLEVPYCIWSDYHGCTVERSNCRVFLDMFGKVDGVIELWGGYNSTGVIVKYELYQTNNEIKETIDSLFEYPCLSDDDLCELEHEIEDEDWNSWIKGDLTSALEAKGIQVPENDNEFRRKFYEACEAANEYPIFETAVSCYVDISKIIINWKCD